MSREGMEKHRPSIASQASGVVLEIGFGSGRNLPYYKSISKLYALDPSSELHDLAQERAKSISFPFEYIQASAENIPLAENMIDFAVSTWNLCSIPRPGLALKEIFRVLKPGGKFIFIEHGKSRRVNIAKWRKLPKPLKQVLVV